MIVLEIDQQVDNFESWKKIFDSDPVYREKMKVKQYQICRFTSEPNHVLVSLLFADVADARIMLAALQTLWGNMRNNIIAEPVARLLQVEESVNL
jgi:hypothetical protein